jgi:hypothetical protein
MTEYMTVSGRYYMPWTNGVPSTGNDWTQYLDSLFAKGGPLARVDSAAGLVAAAVGDSSRRIGLSIMVPYPDPTGDTLRFESHTYSMKSDKDRAAVVEAYLHEVRRRLDGARLAHARFVAFYWLNEGIRAVDTALVPRVAAAVHALGDSIIWIPSFRAAGSLQWRALGFDEAWLQPNYFFDLNIATTRIDSALTMAHDAGMGLEMEFDRRLFSEWRYADRVEPYIAALENTPELRNRSVSMYEGGGALIRLSGSREPWQRALYARLTQALAPPTPSAGR